MRDFLDNIEASLPSMLIGILLLIVAFIVATLVKKLVAKMLNKGSIHEKLTANSSDPKEAGKMITLISNLAFLVVFLLFLPSIFAKLNLEGLSAPFANFTNVIVAFLPSLLAAIVILYIGFFVAKIIRDVVSTVLVRLGVDGFVNRFVNSGSETVKVRVSDVLANIVYAFIVVPLVIIALDLVGLHVISEPAKNIIDTFLSYVPKIFTALILIAVGVFIAKLLANLLQNLLVGFNVDGLLARVGINKQFRLSELISKLIMIVLVVVFAVEALNVLDLAVLTGIGAAIISYLPLVLSAAIIMVGAYLLANYVETKIIERNPQHRFAALLVKVLILGVAVFMTLSQLGFAEKIVEVAFVILLGAVGVAFALSFGLGGREFAKDKLAKLDRKLEEEKLQK